MRSIAAVHIQAGKTAKERDCESIREYTFIHHEDHEGHEENN
jgi:hypothetical protein